MENEVIRSDVELFRWLVDAGVKLWPVE